LIEHEVHFARHALALWRYSEKFRHHYSEWSHRPPAGAMTAPHGTECTTDNQKTRKNRCVKSSAQTGGSSRGEMTGLVGKGAVLFIRYLVVHASNSAITRARNASRREDGKQAQSGSAACYRSGFTDGEARVPQIRIDQRRLIWRLSRRQKHARMRASQVDLRTGDDCG
jgi:hypothetical protein